MSDGVKTAENDSTLANLGCPVAHGFNPAETSAHPDPFGWYRDVRESGRVLFMPSLGMYVVTRADDIDEVLRQPVLFSNSDSLGTTRPVPQTVLDEAGEDWDSHVELFLTLNDPPTHTRMRKLMAPAFAPRRMAAYKDVIQEVADARIDEFEAKGKADIATAFAYRIPNKIIARITGASDEDADNFVSWTEAFLRLRFLDQPEEDSVRDWQMMVDQDRYTRSLISDRRENPAIDLATDLISVTDEGGARALTDDEVVANITGFFGAGSETSAIMILHTLYLLLTHPKQLEEVKADSSLISAAIEESLRLRGPVRGLVRVATAATEIDGVPIPEGARVYLQLASGNHDEEVFDEPDKFDIHRSMDAGHLAFGRGAHFCIGSPLARLEGRVAIEQLLHRLPNLRLAPEQGELQYADNPVLPGLGSLLVEWDSPKW